MKMDIEGSEVDVMPDILFTGGLQYINDLMVEWHERLEKLDHRKKVQRQFQLIIKTLSEYSATMKGHGNNIDFNLVNLDDESYHNTRFELPKC